MNDESQIFVSVLAPCYNEENFISGFIQDLKEQDYPEDKIEFLIIDGLSTDNTKEIFERLTRHDRRFKFATNTNKTVPFAMNLGIEISKGEIIVRTDIHASYPKNYVSELVHAIQKNRHLGVQNVGCALETKPANDSLIAKSIAIAISSKIGVGSTDFRVGVKSDRYVQTVPFGCFYKDTLKSLGGFDLRLTRSQDIALNSKLIANGGKILLISNLTASYYARENFNKLSKMAFQYGYSKVFVGKILGRAVNIQQYVPPILVLSLIFSFTAFAFTSNYLFLFLPSLYFFLILLCAFVQSFSRKYIRLFPLIATAYYTMHISYGIGQLKGYWDFNIKKKDQISSQTPISR